MSLRLSTSIDDLRRNIFVARSRISAPQSRPKRRAILKNGDCFTVDSPKQQKNLLQNIFFPLVQMKLKWTLSVFLMSLLSSWLVFAVLWWLICYTHGDFEPLHLPPYQVSSNFTPCIHQIYGFVSCFLFSIETQHTVGYGIRATTEECPEAIFLNASQCILGTIMQGIMSGIIFTKMTLPNKRAQTVMFSKNAVISLRDGFLCLMFRVGDLRKDHIFETEIKVLLVRTLRTFEGEVLNLHRTPLDVRVDGCEDDVLLMWPVIVTHKIDEKSPLYYITPQRLKYDAFEIIVTVEGSIESTGQSMQAKSSYLPSEVLWGFRFEPLLRFDKYRCEYGVDFSKFENVYVDDTPFCAPRDLVKYDSSSAVREENSPVDAEVISVVGESEV